MAIEGNLARWVAYRFRESGRFIGGIPVMEREEVYCLLPMTYEEARGLTDGMPSRHGFHTV